MPTADEVLAALTALAIDCWPLAALWHAWLGVILFMLVVGWRSPARTLGRLTMLPVASAVVASITGSPFNSATFTLLAVVLVHATIGLSDAPVRLDSRCLVAAGAAMILFGWAYPHSSATRPGRSPSARPRFSRSRGAQRHSESPRHRRVGCGW
jgi:hypothetical protein